MLWEHTGTLHAQYAEQHRVCTFPDATFVAAMQHAPDATVRSVSDSQRVSGEHSRVVDGQAPGAAAGVPAVVLVVGALQDLARHRHVEPRGGVQLQEVRHQARRVQLQLVLDRLQSKDTVSFTQASACYTLPGRVCLIFSRLKPRAKCITMLVHRRAAQPPLLRR